MGDNTITLSDDSDSDKTYDPSYEENKHLRTPQRPQFHTRARNYDQAQSHNETQSQTQQEAEGTPVQKLKIKIKIKRKIHLQSIDPREPGNVILVQVGVLLHMKEKTFYS